MSEDYRVYIDDIENPDQESGLNISEYLKIREYKPLAITIKMLANTTEYSSRIREQTGVENLTRHEIYAAENLDSYLHPLFESQGTNPKSLQSFKVRVFLSMLQFTFDSERVMEIMKLMENGDKNTDLLKNYVDKMHVHGSEKDFLLFFEKQMNSLKKEFGDKPPPVVSETSALLKRIEELKEKHEKENRDIADKLSLSESVLENLKRFQKVSSIALEAIELAKTNFDEIPIYKDITKQFKEWEDDIQELSDAYVKSIEDTGTSTSVESGSESEPDSD